jgi:FkbM family methyltransferase
MNPINELNLEYRTCNVDSSIWLWPLEDRGAWKALTKESNYTLPDKISKFCNNFDLVFQAGGNAGIYPKHYSKIFNSVITVEPDYRNFFCLNFNVTDKNVFKFQTCIGNENKTLDLGFKGSYTPKNRGKMRVQGPGLIPQITIDSLSITPDLIHLDIEGYEGFALEGAVQTIKNFKPVIVLETNGSGDAYGWPQEKIDSFLFSLGYDIIEDWGHDKIYGVISG